MTARISSSIVWGLAGFGVTMAGLAFAVIAIGLLEGWHPMPDRLSEIIAILIAATAAWTGGLLCARASRPAAAAIVTPLLIAGLGFILMERTEGHGKGLAPQVVAEAVAAAAIIVGGATYVACRSAPQETGPVVA